MSLYSWLLTNHSKWARRSRRIVCPMAAVAAPDKIKVTSPAAIHKNKSDMSSNGERKGGVCHL